MLFTTFPLFLLPLLVASQSLSSQTTESSSQTTNLYPFITASTSPPSPLELRAQPPVAAPAAPAPAVPAVPAVPVPAAPAAPAGGAGGGGGGAPIGASPKGTQVPTITTIMQNTVIGGVPTQRPVVFTQTFKSVISQGPTPESGTIGLGTLKGSLGTKETGKAKGKRLVG